MTTQQIIIQSLHQIDQQHPDFQQLMALSQCDSVTQINGQVLKLEGVTRSAEALEQMQRVCFGAQWDLTALSSPLSLSDFKLVAMDMDSTLITIECIDEIADMQGLKPQVAAITESAMRGEIAFAESLRQRVALLAGLDAHALHKVYEERLRLSPGAEELLAAVKAADIKTLLASGGFTFFTPHLRARLGLDFSNANQLEIVDGTLTGKVHGAIVDAQAKKETVKTVCDGLGIHPSQAIVMGDGANDLEMMSIAGLSVAYRAKPVVREQADVALNFCGLDGLLNILR